MGGRFSSSSSSSSFSDAKRSFDDGSGEIRETKEMMGRGISSSSSSSFSSDMVTRSFADGSGLIDLLFSWSIDDIFNENLYKNKVSKIPKTFPSVDHYFESYVFPLLEETRTQLCSSMEDISTAPFAEIIDFSKFEQREKALYNVQVDHWRNRINNRGQEPYKPLPGDIFVIADAKPETIYDLQRVGRSWTFAVITRIIREDVDEEDDAKPATYFTVETSKDIEVNDEMQRSLFAFFLINTTTNRRIWKALHMYRNLKIIDQILCADSLVENSCDICSVNNTDIGDESLAAELSSRLNDSQIEAVFSCLRKLKCIHKSSSVELIWGPPGTGKTKTMSLLLFTLMRRNLRILTCAPTNIAITEMVSRVVTLVKESFEANLGMDALFCSFGDILLFGNKERLKVGSDIKGIYLDYRVERLIECFGPSTGWKHCFSSMIDFLENCVSHYHLIKEKDCSNKNEGEKGNELIKQKDCSKENEGTKGNCKSFLEYARDCFKDIALPLQRCVVLLCTHIPKSYLMEHNLKNLQILYGLVSSFQQLLNQENVVSEELEEHFSRPGLVEASSQSFVGSAFQLYVSKTECLSVLRDLRSSLGKLHLPSNKDSIIDFCFQRASLIFCTASSSYKFHSRVLKPPPNLLVIDEAAQLKECESIIPLQLPGIRHAILIGDECQLQATVHSTVSVEAGFGRSLFKRLSSLGHSKHLLNIQYRMQPSISAFPNSKFYSNRILNGPNVTSKSYEKHYLPGSMFGSYSFINVFHGREELDDVGHSQRNMVEVAVVIEIVRNLHKARIDSRESLSVGVISPYAAQVVAIRDKIGRKYEKLDGFSVKVKSVDGFQGGEEDIIIISTVRSNRDGSIGFMSNRQRTNVALTRARHNLWILGNERTLVDSNSVWKALVQDAKARKCFFDADDDKDLGKAILKVKKDLDQLDDLLNGDSMLFKNCRWKVLFSEDFKRSFANLRSVQTKKSIINVLLKLSSGWRPKKRNVDSVCGSSSHILKQFKVGGLHVICTIDIIKESSYMQVLKVWDTLPLEEISKLVKRLNGIFVKYTDDYINRCQEKYFEGGLEVPKSWVTTTDIIQFKSSVGDGSNLSGDDDTSYVENSRVSESLLLMKFYPLSSDVVRHLLSDRDVRELELPFEVTDQEREIILFDRSTFILGRSGTGKTTVLTMKLYQKEQWHHIITEATYGVKTSTSEKFIERSEVGEGSEETKRPVLKQLFVTVSPKLCYAVKQHVFRLKSLAQGGDFSSEINSFDMDFVDDTAQFKDIRDSFVDIPLMAYPLVITFRKFLMMLDGTYGISYFERFQDVRILSQGKTGSLKSTALQTFIRTREVNYDRFSSSYWPRFNTQLTKKLDSSRVFTEIMSHIKGGMRAGESCDGKLNRESYVLLSESRAPTLSKQKREIIYNVFQDYEKMKMENGDFDLADLVIDLHQRLRYEKYEAVAIDFVYIDEVQDLTMRQIALFKYVCRNIKEGFVFSGDTAQTIARGIDFRFQDIRSLFYNEFVLQAKHEGSDGRKEKGQISEIFHLSQNFRTHAGVLKLAQSIIDLLYRFFPESIDVLSPETSLIYGEAPILLESGNDENAIITIFGNSGNAGGNISGFGAEQVILVRDESVRKEISGYVGKQALVLTILECKGLEFQDVLLYNFFGSSPLKNWWRVIYEYMKEQDLLDSSGSFPSFDQAKHNILCSELKHLYVAITRTRQRLLICENVEELSKPIFDYWKKLNLVQVRQLDASMVQDMQVKSSSEEWRSQGIKLLGERSFEMATMCFEKAGDAYWEKYAKAAGLRASADRMHYSSPVMARDARKQAAEIFESIGKADYAAECFYLLEEFEKAGRLYLEKFGDSKLEIAGECFSRAGCYKLAAEVYAKGNYFSECLSACSKGNLFETGLRYIQYWKQNTARRDVMAKTSNAICKIEQNFLKNCALHYYELKDNRAMMKFVKAFSSIDSIRTFLKALDCLDELLLLEEESGNFLEAANIAKLKGDLLLEADLLGKAGNFKNASLHILWYVLAYSLWAPGSSGWPLKQFTEKEQLLEKAQEYAKNESDLFYEAVCTETGILSDKLSSLVKMKQYLNNSRRHQNLRGEVLLARKILDVHFTLSASKYDWEDKVAIDLTKDAEEKISHNRVSVETLVYFWHLWKEKIANVFEYLGHLETEDVNEYRGYGEFCLNYLGVWRQFVDLKANYVLFKSDVNWVREIDNRSLRRSGRLVFIDVRQFVAVARCQWSLEFLSVGMKVLEVLEALYKFSTKNTMSTFCQTMPLVHIFDIAKCILESKFLDYRHLDSKTLRNLLQVSTEHLFGNVFPLNWRKSLVDNMIFLRGTELFSNLLKGIISESISSKNKLTYGQIGRVAVMILGFGKLSNELFEKIGKRFEGNLPWKVFIENLGGDRRPDFEKRSVLYDINKVSLVYKFHEALVDTYNANWRKEYDYISPGCFLYLMERLLILVSSCQGYFFTTKASVVEWFVYQEWDSNPSPNSVTNMLSLGPILDQMAYTVHQLLQNKQDTLEWIKKSGDNVKDYYPLLLLRLLVILCLLCVNVGEHYDLLLNILGRSDITSNLPCEFYDVLRERLKRNDAVTNVKMIAEAFKKIENPLVIVSSGQNCSKFLSSDSIFVDLMANRRREDILSVLFPNKNPPSQGQSGDVEPRTANLCSEGDSLKLPSSEIASIANQDHNAQLNTEGDLQIFRCPFWEIVDDLMSEKSGKGDYMKTILSCAPRFKVELEKNIHLLTDVMTQSFNKNFCDGEYGDLFGEANSMLDETKQFVAALNGSDSEMENNISRIQELLMALQQRKPRLVQFLKLLDSFNAAAGVVGEDVVSGRSSSSGAGNDKDEKWNNAEEEECVPDEDMMQCGMYWDESGSPINGFFVLHQDKMKASDTKSNKGKGNNNKKSKRGKGGRKK